MLKRMLNQLGWEGWTFLLCGATAIGIAILDFTQIINLSTENALKILIVGTGMVLGAIAAQASRRSVELSDLIGTLRISSTELIEQGEDFQLHVKQTISKAQ